MSKHLCRDDLYGRLCVGVPNPELNFNIFPERRKRWIAGSFCISFSSHLHYSSQTVQSLCTKRITTLLIAPGPLSRTSNHTPRTFAILKENGFNSPQKMAAGT
eukprot:gnl/TRDRNA2_/TRDRNA2_124659_c1_seq1.p1 gnl/TRDRNA2_/TRDRNA2_124659_c1~~gnl/TRDRNA2_/TRDRNA2_124659_c1_seq1.p1  ORF type:complete len:103 (+),score=3.96 gnl/TRDRNA2_/TRDRNA2_124659_c1_seq1:15-323(+)